jgi:hypothetical protein
MAAVNPRSVYYPEPNTFVKVKTDWDLDQLEDGISFGTGSQEGQQLAESLRAKRGGLSEGFDSRYALETDMSRVGSNVGGLGRDAALDEATFRKLFDLAQSHARQQEWQTRVADLYGLTADVIQPLAKMVYNKVTDLTVLSQLAEKDLTPTTPIDGGRLRKVIKDHPKLASLDKEIVTMAAKSRDRLLFAFSRAYRELSNR